MEGQLVIINTYRSAYFGYLPDPATFCWTLRHGTLNSIGPVYCAYTMFSAVRVVIYRCSHCDHGSRGVCIMEFRCPVCEKISLHVSLPVGWWLPLFSTIYCCSLFYNLKSHEVMRNACRANNLTVLLMLQRPDVLLEKRPLVFVFGSVTVLFTREH